MVTRLVLLGFVMILGRICSNQTTREKNKPNTYQLMKLLRS